MVKITTQYKFLALNMYLLFLNKSDIKYTFNIILFKPIVYVQKPFSKQNLNQRKVNKYILSNCN